LHDKTVQEGYKLDVLSADHAKLVTDAAQ